MRIGPQRRIPFKGRRSERDLTALFCLTLVYLWPIAASAEERTAVQRGEYVFRASGGCSCHTAPATPNAFMAGGRPLKTPFGTAYATNITPDPQTGIGAWTNEDFVRSMRQGVAPDGSHYLPVFPYTSFTKMSRQDLLDLKAYLFSLPAIEQENIPHQLDAPFGWRPLIGIWKALYFEPGPFEPDPGRDAQWNRGAYLATALGHCAECHTPRDAIGGLENERAYAGSAAGPEGELAPNITPDPQTGIGPWTPVDLVYYLQTGFKPDGDDTQGLMAELIDNGYQYMSRADLEALAAYLRSLPPMVNQVAAEK